MNPTHTDRPTVGSAMTTELLTVAPDDRLDLAGLLMERRRIRQLVVVDHDGRLLGLVSYRAILRLLAARRAGEIEEGGRVDAFMVPDPVTVTTATPLREAIRLMLEHDVSAVPVVDGHRVVGILSEHDVARVAGELLAEAPRRTDAP